LYGYRAVSRWCLNDPLIPRTLPHHGGFLERCWGNGGDVITIPAVVMTTFRHGVPHPTPGDLSLRRCVIYRCCEQLRYCSNITHTCRTFVFGTCRRSPRGLCTRLLPDALPTNVTPLPRSGIGFYAYAHGRRRTCRMRGAAWVLAHTFAHAHAAHCLRAHLPALPALSDQMVVVY